MEGEPHRPAYAVVAEQIRDAIVRGDLVGGAPLPPERDLVSRYGVSRATVREALRALQAQGLLVADTPNAPARVASHADVSTRVAHEAISHLLLLGGVSLPELTELRCAVEAAAVDAAARRADDIDFSLVEAEIAAMHAAGTDTSAFEAADVAFHLAMVEASGNRVFHLVMLAVRETIAAYLHESLERQDDLRATLVGLADAHEQILRAVRSGNHELAVAIVRNHVRELYEPVTRSR